VQLERKKSGSWGVAKPVIAGFMVVLLLGITALAASPSLHEFFHSDAGSTDHNCAVTLFTRGQITTPGVTQILAVVAVLFGGAALLAETFQFSTTDYCFSSSRAPPSASF
jgi:hypothetical protein